MVQSDSLDDAQTILLATQFVTESNFQQLQLLAAERTQSLTTSFLYRLLLTYLPIDAESIPDLILFLKHLESGLKDVSNLDEALDRSQGQVITLQESRKRLHELRLGGEKHSTTNSEDYDDDLSSFVIQWIHKVEKVSGISSSVLRLPEPFLLERPKLRLWYNSYLLPIVRLQTEYYPGRAESFDTEALERLNGIAGVKNLLQFAEEDGEQAHIGRDLAEVVTPWVHGASKAKRRRLVEPNAAAAETSWHDVNEWIYDTGRSRFNLAARSFLEWDGPQVDSTLGSGTDSSESTQSTISYIQTGLALITTSAGTGENINILLRQLLDRAASLSATVTDVSIDPSRLALSNSSKADLLDNSILRPTNPITYPSEEVFDFLDNCLATQRLLEGYKISLPMVAIIDIALYGSEERQKQELLRLLQQIPRLTRSEIDWPQVRQHVFVLRSGRSGSNAYTYLGRVPLAYLESEFLDVLIASGQYTAVSGIYLSTDDPPLEQDQVQAHAVAAIYEAYDNASNGNRTRGGMKRASEILTAFRSKFTSAPVFKHIDYLIRATHSLSFYQLTLQHGVPFRPATIRVHHDPVSLIEKVLSQNHKAFTKLDDLIEIGRNLVEADVPNSTDPSWPTKSLNERLFDTQHRITYLAIISALKDHDFDTAYSYITTRLATSPAKASDSNFTDDTSWRAAYAAGKYRPSTSPRNLHDRITGLSKRMDLLSLALTLTPTPEPLSEILATWRRCEEEMESLRSQALDEERAADSQSRGYSTLPGGFAEDRDIDAAETRRMMEKRALGGSGPSYEEEAPMGLFDVARGAASAFRKSAFPLRGAGQQVNIRDSIGDDGSGRESLDEQRASGEFQRVRKRDMVSNMVTGGLVSGMSWVLGAPASRPDDNR